VSTDDSSFKPHIDGETGILFCDYWLVKRKRYDVPALYDPKGIYLYKVKPASALKVPELDRLTQETARHQLARPRHNATRHHPLTTRHDSQNRLRQHPHQRRSAAPLQLQLAVWLLLVGRGVLDAQSGFSGQANVDRRSCTRHAYHS